MMLDLIAQPGRVDHQAPHAAAQQRLQRPLHQRLAAHRQQRLGAGVGQRAHALATTGGEDQGAGGSRIHARTVEDRSIRPPEPLRAGGLSVDGVTPWHG